MAFIYCLTETGWRTGVGQSRFGLPHCQNCRRRLVRISGCWRPYSRLFSSDVSVSCAVLFSTSWKPRFKGRLFQVCRIESASRLCVVFMCRLIHPANQLRATGLALLVISSTRNIDKRWEMRNFIHVAIDPLSHFDHRLWWSTKVRAWLIWDHLRTFSC